MKSLFTFCMASVMTFMAMAEAPLLATEAVEEEAPFQIVIEDDPTTLGQPLTPVHMPLIMPEPSPTPEETPVVEDDEEDAIETKDVEPIDESALNHDDKDGLELIESDASAMPSGPAPSLEQTTPPPAVEIVKAPTLPAETTIVVVSEADEAPDPVPNCGHGLQPPKGFDLEVLMLQIFLDRHNFSTGVIDGVWGKGSRDAMRAWQASDGRRRTQWIDPTLYGELATMFEAIISYTVTEEDVALVTGPSPATWAERAKLPLMGYESLAACLAEKFHTSERTLHYLNPAIANWSTDIKLGSVIRVPNVRQAALTPVVRIVIILEDCLLLGYDADGIMRLRFPCSIARKRAHLPETGNVTVKNMAPAPNYTYDPANYGQDPSVGKMILPPGPRNPVGSRWIGLSLPGYGIHGTPKPNTVGRPESRGCFRLTNWNAEKLFELVKPGVRVEIVQSVKDIANQRTVSSPEAVKATKDVE